MTDQIAGPTVKLCSWMHFYFHLPSISYLISGVILQFRSLSHSDNPITLHFTSLAVTPKPCNNNIRFYFVFFILLIFASITVRTRAVHFCYNDNKRLFWIFFFSHNHQLPISQERGARRRNTPPTRQKASLATLQWWLTDVHPPLADQVFGGCQRHQAFVQSMNQMLFIWHLLIFKRCKKCSTD